jgi:hypothetical protein
MTETEEEILYKDILNKEVNNLIANEWLFLNMNWSYILHKFNHRSELKDVKFIKFIKDVLLEQLGYIPVFYFLNVIYGSIEYPGPYREIEKGLLILYHMVSGLSGRKMHQFISYTTYYELYKRFWQSNYNNLNKLINLELNRLFSNIKIRILAAIVKNPKGFKDVTLMIDGHDGKIKYYDPDTKTKLLYSYKLKGSGLRTQIVTDMNQMILFISESQKCGIGNDGTMFLNMKLHNKMHIGDCLAMDGGYNLFISKFKENSLNAGKDFSDKNFVYPIRKENNSKLTASELTYNSIFGSFRSDIENHFSVLASKFNRFNNNTAALQITDIKYYNLQFRVACLLKNIWRMVEDYNIEVQPHHMLWYNDNYEFPKKESKLDIVFSDKIEADKNHKEMKELQKEILNLNINEEIELISDAEEDVEMEEVVIKRKKAKKPIVVVENLDR